IVSSTERATSEILAAAERIQEASEKLREAGADEKLCQDLDEQSVHIFTACSFQDITGQRTSKVVQVLRYLEARVNAMVQIWEGAEDGKPVEDPTVDTRPDAHLLNGPQNEDVAISQDDVDRMLSGEAEGSAALPEAASQEDIDALFDEPSAA
ncbi:MAG: protein phosphatase CheZ, partial [Pseudomonadota bacterium]